MLNIGWVIAASLGEEGENRFGADPLEPIEEPES